jgi:hypothetical protein
VLLVKGERKLFLSQMDKRIDIKYYEYMVFPSRWAGLVKPVKLLETNWRVYVLYIIHQCVCKSIHVRFVGCVPNLVSVSQSFKGIVAICVFLSFTELFRSHCHWHHITRFTVIMCLFYVVCAHLCALTSLSTPFIVIRNLYIFCTYVFCVS